MNHAQVTELSRALRLLGEHGEQLTTDTPPAKIAEIRADLTRTARLLEETAGPPPTTDCPQHPYGAVDEDAPDRCLFCAARRARANGGTRTAPPPGTSHRIRPHCPECDRPFLRTPGTPEPQPGALCRDCQKAQAADQRS